MKSKSMDLRLLGILVVSLALIITGAFFSYNAIMQGEVAGALGGGLIAIVVLAFAIFIYIRGNNDLKNGLPLKDERSEKVLEKATSKAFYVTLYMLLAIGFLSDGAIEFRDVSQAMNIAVGGMAALFVVFWFYYNKKEM